MNKIYLQAAQLQADSFELAKAVVLSNFQPTVLIGLWRGGCPIAITVHEVIEACGIKCEHLPLKISSYTNTNQRQTEVKITGLDVVTSALTNHDRLLIVDDVHDSGVSMQTLLDQLSATGITAQIKIATLYFKPDQSLVDFTPDFYLHETNNWIVFPHELSGLSNEELEHHKPAIDKIKGLLIKHSSNS